MLMGILILRRHYGISKYFAVVLITAGIAISTIASSANVVRSYVLIAKHLVCSLSTGMNELRPKITKFHAKHNN